MTDQRPPESATTESGGLLDAVRQKIAEGDYEQALDLCHQAARDPALATDAIALVGVIAYHVKGYGRAIGMLEQAQARPDASDDLPEILAVLYALTGDLPKALFYGKLAAVMEFDNRIRPALGEDFPAFATVFMNMQSEPMLQRGRGLLRQGRLDEAIETLEQHLALRPSDAGTMDALSEAYLEAGRPAPAVDLLRGLRAGEPDNPALASRLGRALTAVGELTEGDACHAVACELATDDPEPAVLRLRDLAYHGTAGGEVHADVCRRLARAADGFADDAPPTGGAAPTPTIGFLCAGARHEDLLVVAAALARRQPGLRVFGYGLGSLGSGRYAPLREAFDEWRDVSELDAWTVAAIARGDGIDVLVDLAGLDGPLVAVLAVRAAPVQVAWFGHPLGPALPGVDLRLTGPNDDAAPEGAAPARRLPMYPYLVTGGPAPAAAGGSGGITFAADAILGEINPALASHWARILHRVPDSMLLLRDHDFRRHRNSQRLIDLFGSFGVAHRVDVVTAESGVDFFQQADVALAAFPHCRPGRLADALRAGVPVVALAQPGTVAGETAPLLAGLDAGTPLTAASPGGYVETAVTLAADADARESFRRGLGERLKAAGLGDPTALAAALQEALTEMSGRSGA